MHVKHGKSPRKLQIHELIMEPWPSGYDTGFPVQGSYVQNHWVAPRSTQPFIFPRLIKDKMCTRNFIVAKKTHLVNGSDPAPT